MTAQTLASRAALDVETFHTPGLGDSSYMIASGGEAALVDPQRDAWRYLAAAERRGLRITHTLETHLHNDYLTGAIGIRDAAGAQVVAPARARYTFPHRAASDGDEVVVGGLRLVCAATPGHTLDHVAWQVVPDGAAQPVAVFTGGSLLKGGAGRTDLFGEQQTNFLAALQFRSVRRLARLPADVRVLPTHGGGSFCAAGDATGGLSSTIGEERMRNPLLSVTDATRFRETLLASIGPIPDYASHIAPINRAGPTSERVPRSPRAMSPQRFAQLGSTGAWAVDTRNRRAFASGHVPGSLNVEPDESFAAHVGSLVPFGVPVGLILDPGERDAATDLATELYRIGYEVVGVLALGIDAWATAGFPLDSYTAVTIGEVAAEVHRHQSATVVDVRNPAEWQEGTVPGSMTIPLAELPSRVSELMGAGVDPRPVLTVLCKSGRRAATAASFLARAGIAVRLVAEGGALDWRGASPASVSLRRAPLAE